MENKHLADGLINKLKGLTAKLEQFQVDVSLGKAEAKDKIEEYRKEVNGFVNTVKQDLSGGTGLVGKMKSDIEELELQAHLGEMEAKDYFSVQKNKIIGLINKADQVLKENLS